METRPEARGINSPISPQCKGLNFLGYYWRILFPLSLPFFILFMLPVWASKKLRSQQWRPPWQLERQPTMAPAKKKATAGTTSTSTEPGRTLDGPQPQHEGANPRIEDITMKLLFMEIRLITLKTPKLINSQKQHSSSRPLK